MPEGMRREAGEERVRVLEQLEGEWHVVVTEDPVGPDPMCLCASEEFRVARISGGRGGPVAPTRGRLHLGAPPAARLQADEAVPPPSC